MAGTHRIRLIPKYDDVSVEPGTLAHASELKGYMIADPAPDIRGWAVQLRDRRAVGTVDDLVVDTNDLIVKYLELKVNREFSVGEEDEWVLVPMTTVRLDDTASVAVIDRLSVHDIERIPRSRRGQAARRPPTKAEVDAAWGILDIDSPVDSAVIDAVVSNRPLEQ